MFTNLIESQSHVREFKRRSSFFLITVVGYAIVLTGAGSDEGPRVRITDDAKPPEPPPVKPPTTRRVTSEVLNSKLITAPQPIYPAIARQARLQGAVNIQILVDEQGKVISAQVMSG